MIRKLPVMWRPLGLSPPIRREPEVRRKREKGRRVRERADKGSVQFVDSIRDLCPLADGLLLDSSERLSTVAKRQHGDPLELPPPEPFLPSWTVGPEGFAAALTDACGASVEGDVLPRSKANEENVAFVSNLVANHPAGQPRASGAATEKEEAGRRRRSARSRLRLGIRSSLHTAATTAAMRAGVT